MNLHEGAIKIPGNIKIFIRNFLIRFENEVESLRTEFSDGKYYIKCKNDVLGKVLKKFQEVDLIKNSKIKDLSLKMSLRFDFQNVEGAFTTAQNNNKQGIIIMSTSKFFEYVHHNSEWYIGNINWPRFKSVFIHECIHFVQYVFKSELHPHVFASKKSYMDRPYEQQAWAEGYLELVRQKLKTADPKKLLSSLYNHGVLHDDDLKKLKQTNYSAWKGIMKQAVMSSLMDLKKDQILPWQKERSLP